LGWRRLGTGVLNLRRGAHPDLLQKGVHVCTLSTARVYCVRARPNYRSGFHSYENAKLLLFYGTCLHARDVISLSTATGSERGTFVGAVGGWWRERWSAWVLGRVLGGV
jgi:hypothetical protein